MEKRYKCTTIVIVLSFMMIIFGIGGIFTILKAVRINDYFENHIVDAVEKGDYDAENRYRDYLIKKYHSYAHGDLDLNGMIDLSEKDIKNRDLPLLQKSIFATSYQTKYEKSLLYSDDAPMAVKRIYQINPWREARWDNENQFYGIGCFVLAIMAGIIAIRYRLYKDKRSEESMTAALSKGLSYELETPLKELKESVEAWKLAGTGEKNDATAKIVSEVDYMDAIIKNLLRFRDFESGRINLECEEVNLYYLTKIVYDRLSPILKEKKLKVSIHADHPEECVVNADPEIMKIVIGNMILKSVEYSQETIQINLDSNKNMSFHMIWDDYRMNKKVAKVVWREYYVSDECSTDEFGSNGVGLAAAGRMLKAHKAKFGCEPYMKGTMFWFSMKKA